jgi:tetratricopeptide (TPR) repeat protein
VLSRATTSSVLVLVVLSRAAAALADDAKLEADDLPPPQAEAVNAPPAVETPALPAFDLPVMPAGLHGPRELRVHGKPLLGTEIKVMGFITAIYDCPAKLAASNPTATRGQILTAIDNDPALCGAGKFYLGDAKTTSPDTSIWVVEVPQPPGKRAREQLKAERKAAPAVPKLAIGDYVTVTGTWATQSQHGEHNTAGLLIYRTLAPAPASAAPPATAPAGATAEPELVVTTKPPLRPKVNPTARNVSTDQLNACIKAIAARQYDAAIASCQSATKAWNGNHLAWYTLASAHMAKSEWPQAKAAVERAVTQRPDQGMYQLYHGISLFEAARVRPAAPVPGSAPAAPVPSGPVNLDEARDALRRATQLDPSLWRAHYYLGRLYRELDDAKRAAEQFTLTIKTHPSYRFGYIALSELYRRWDYADQALAVAKLGTANVAPTEASELWFEVGMAQDAKRATQPAIEAFTKAIELRPQDVSSKFQRGQLYYRANDFAAAKRDLDDVVKSTAPEAASMNPVATQLLSQIAKQKR